MDFGEIDTGYLTVPACHKTPPVHTVVLDLEDPLVFYTPVIRGHKTFVSLAPDLLFIHTGEFFAKCFSSLLARVFVGMIPCFVEGFWFFIYGLGVIDHHGQIDLEV